MADNGKWTILIAEDDADLNNGICFYFKSQGYQCIQAFDGAAALELFESNIINLVILDVMMPVKSGYEVLRTLRSHSGVPIIMLTALSEERDKLEAFAGWVRRLSQQAFQLKGARGQSSSPHHPHLSAGRQGDQRPVVWRPFRSIPSAERSP